jgi:transcriptional repressor NrdR
MAYPLISPRQTLPCHYDAQESRYMRIVMNCPGCHQKDTRVIDSRLVVDSNTIKRRRKCDLCSKRFTTFEKIQLERPLVVKRDGRREEFSQEKVLQGIQKACQKRPISTVQIEKTIDSIIKNILESYDEEILTQDIGHLVMTSLRDLDPVAYIRFASVYKTFQDIDEFVKDLTKEQITLQQQDTQL